MESIYSAKYANLILFTSIPLDRWQISKSWYELQHFT